MADEQIIYLSPEEELTSVRERLEQVKARRIILVIPPQTHLRSHVGWRVLHARMRELGKEVLVISSDRQIRAVAKAVGFRVADSLESPSSNRPRPASRPGRMAPGGKTTTRSRSAPPAKGSTENRTSSQRKQPAQRALDEQLAQQPPREAESKISSAGEAITGKGADLASSTFGEDDYESPDDQPTPPPSPSRGTNTSRAGQARREEYDFHIEASPPASPRVPEHDDEEFPDSFIDHYNQAQFIRQQFQAEEPTSKHPANAAGVNDLSAPPLTPARGRGDRSTPPLAPARGATTSRQGDEDVYGYYLEDSHPVSLPEQHGSAPVEDIDTGIPDLSDIPTDILEGEIEDLGDEGDILVQPEAMRQSWDEPIEEEERPYPSRVYGSRLPGSRSGGLRPQQPLPEPDIDDEDMLAPAADRPTLVRPPSPARRSGTLPPAASSNRGLQPIIPPQTRTGQPKPASQQAKKPAKKGRTVTTSPQKKPAAAVQTPARRRNNRKTLTAFLAVVAILLILLGLFYIVPSAQVTISVPSYPLTINPLHLSANMNAKDKTLNTMASVVLNYDKSVTGTGNATGTSQVGNAQASGLVNFTNKGTVQVDIPTGILLSTSNGIQFVTAGDALILPASSIPPVPVQAVKAGNNGNVAAGSITVISSDGLSKIAQKNNVSVSSLNLSVTNPAELTGGGSAPATSVTNNDIQSEKTTLSSQLQGDLKTWLAQNVHKGDIQGTPVLQSETVTTTPVAGQVTNDGKFSETIHVHVTVLVVRAAALQAAAAGQLNAAALKMNPSYVLVTGQAVTLSKIKSTASKDGSSISISLDARGQIMQRVSVDAIRNTLVGKTRDQATSDITNGLGGLHGVFHSAIQVSPGFLPILPVRADRITVILKPVPTATPTKGVPNGG